MSKLARTAVGVVKLVVVVAVASAAGVGVGLAVAELRDGGSSTAARTTTGPTPPGGPRSKDAGARLSVTVRSAVLQYAETERGRRRKRARVSVTISVRNDGQREGRLAEPRLLSGRSSLRHDRRQAGAGRVLRAVAPGRTTTGTLHFETAGELTDRLVERRRAGLRVGDRTRQLRLRLRAPYPPGVAGAGTTTAPAPAAG